MHKLSLSALVSNTLNRQITNVRIVSLAPALIDWRSPATQSTQYNTISKVLIKSFSPGEEFLDYENSEYCRLPKNFEFMIIVFCIMYDNIIDYDDKLGKCCIQIVDYCIHLESVIN